MQGESIPFLIGKRRSFVKARMIEKVISRQLGPDCARVSFFHGVELIYYLILP